MSTEQKKPFGVSRRNFLRTVGIASGAAAVSPVIPGSVSSAIAKSVLGTGAPIKIGVLARSGIDGTESLLAGLSLRLRESNNQISGHPIELIVEDIGEGVSKVRASMLKLIEKDGVKVILGQLNARAVGRFETLIRESGISFVEMSAGECIPHVHERNTSIFRSTLNLWQAYSALGGWASQNLGKKGAIATSFYNGGFDIHGAFQNGFEAAGGEVVAMKVTGSHVVGDHPNGVMTAFKELHPDFIFASYSATPATVFVQAYRTSGVSAPLLGTNFIAGASPANPERALGTMYATSWSEALENAENKKFCAAYKAFAGKSADASAVLGYDTASWVISAIQNAGSADGSARFIAAMKNASFASPRGNIRFDAGTQTLRAPLYLCERTSEGGLAASRIMTELSSPAESEASILDCWSREATSGWYNSFMYA